MKKWNVPVFMKMRLANGDRMTLRRDFQTKAKDVIEASANVIWAAQSLGVPYQVIEGKITEIQS